MNRKTLQKEIAWLYPWLQDFCRRIMARERKNHTLQPTALTNEVLARLLNWKGELVDDSESSLRHVASTIAKQTLIDSGRKNARKQKFLATKFERAGDSSTDAEQIAKVRSALAELQSADPQLREFVELRFFQGYSVSEASAILGWSERTAARRWTFIKSWLENYFED